MPATTPDKNLDALYQSASDSDYESLSIALWEIIEDVIDSADLALKVAGVINREELIATVRDYAANHYGEDA